LALANDVANRLASPIENLLGTFANVQISTTGISIAAQVGNPAAGSALSAFGSFSFGNSGAAPSPVFAGAMQASFGTVAGGTAPLVSGVLGSVPTGPSIGVNAAGYNQALGVVGGITVNPSIAQGLALGVLATVAQTGGGVPDHAVNNDGLVLSPDAYGMINAQRPGYSQIGSATAPPLPNSTQFPWQQQPSSQPPATSVVPLQDLTSTVLNATPGDQSTSITQGDTVFTFGPEFQPGAVDQSGNNFDTTSFPDSLD
jgi:hypothetical protein